MKNMAMCTAQNRNHAERIIQQLLGAGFTKREISVVLPNSEAPRVGARLNHDAVPGGAIAGKSCTLGSAIGALAEIGSLAIPRFGLFIVANPPFAASNDAADEALTDELTCSFISVGVPRFEARRFAAKVRGGNLLVFVRVDSSDALTRVTDIFTATYAVDICSTCEVGSSRVVPSRSNAREETSCLFVSSG
jgi:hypothetical protein